MLERKPNVLHDKVEKFTDRIVKMVMYLRRNNLGANEHISQISRSGTSIGANVAESKNAQSRADFVYKLGVALKEADETAYWLRKLYVNEALTEKEYASMDNDAKEIIYLLTAIIKKTKANGL